MAYKIDKPKKHWVTLDGEEIAPKLVNNIFNPVSEDQAKQIIIARKKWLDETDDRKLNEIREIRDNIFNKTDWKIIKASEQGEELSEEFKTWRQNLRDIPQDYKPSDYNKLLEKDTKTRELKHSIWQEPKE